MSRSRNWMFTLFPDVADLSPVTDPDPEQVKYMVWQNEIAPSSKRSHLQGYVCFHNPKGLSGAKKYFGHTVHLEVRQGTHQQAYDYCTKEDTRLPDSEPVEFGEPPSQGHRTDLDEASSLALSGATELEIAESHPSTYVKFHKGLLRLSNLRPPVRDEPPTVTLLIGPSGSGKTRYVFDNEKDELWCSPVGSSKWFDGYERQEAVLFDDFYGSISLDNMLRILDRYPFRVEVKGGFVWWCPKRIYITSNDPPELWYPQKDLTAFYRRIHSIVKLQAGECDLPPWRGPPRESHPAGGEAASPKGERPASPSLEHFIVNGTLNSSENEGIISS